MNRRTQTEVTRELFSNFYKLSTFEVLDSHQIFSDLIKFVRTYRTYLQNNMRTQVRSTYRRCVSCFSTQHISKLKNVPPLCRSTRQAIFQILSFKFPITKWIGRRYSVSSDFTVGCIVNASIQRSHGQLWRAPRVFTSFRRRCHTRRNVLKMIYQSSIILEREVCVRKFFLKWNSLSLHGSAVYLDREATRQLMVLRSGKCPRKLSPKCFSQMKGHSWLGSICQSLYLRFQSQLLHLPKPTLFPRSTG